MAKGVLRHLILLSVVSRNRSGFSTRKLQIPIFLIQGGSFQILGLFDEAEGAAM